MLADLRQCVVVQGPGDGQAVESLHGDDRRGNRLRGAGRLHPEITRRQVTILLQPHLEQRTQRARAVKCG